MLCECEFGGGAYPALTLEAVSTKMETATNLAAMDVSLGDGDLQDREPSW